MSKLQEYMDGLSESEYSVAARAAELARFEAVAGEPISDDHARTLWSLARMISSGDWIKEIRKSLYTCPAVDAGALDMIAAVDAAMVEMANITPPLRRSECERLIRAALTAKPEAAAGAPVAQWQFRVKDVGSPLWTNITHEDARELSNNPAFELRALTMRDVSQQAAPIAYQACGADGEAIWGQACFSPTTGAFKFERALYTHPASEPKAALTDEQLSALHTVLAVMSISPNPKDQKAVTTLRALLHESGKD
jgi:hypothetical protein